MTVTINAATVGHVEQSFVNLKVNVAENNIAFVIKDNLDGNGTLDVLQLERFSDGGANAKFHTDLEVYDGAWITVLADFLEPVDISVADRLRQPAINTAGAAIGDHRATKLKSYYTTGSGMNSGFRLVGRLVATDVFPVDFYLRISITTSKSVA